MAISDPTAPDDLLSSPIRRCLKRKFKSSALRYSLLVYRLENSTDSVSEFQ